MPLELSHWQVQPIVELPKDFLQAVQHHAKGLPGRYVAQLLWQRGLQDPDQLPGYLDPNLYQPTSPFAFGQEMEWAIARLQQAHTQGETVAIWGDFDADGVTATAVLWEGLGAFFCQEQQLFYTIPNRLTDSHGLSISGIEVLASQGCNLIVTCDTGSTNLVEIDHARSLGMDVIVTDHHTLPAQRPQVTAILNPRYLPGDHPLAHLSGVAVAYKLVEALHQTLPQVPQSPVTDLLDLVAIGLIADLVQLSGDCRYLAQRGIERLQQQLQHRSRPGVACLLELCKKTGDRPTDISFGLGPRINAVSRIQGDARFCVELLTSREAERCRQLAQETEVANTRRKALQRDMVQQVKAKLGHLDLSTTRVIVLWEPEWPVGILGIVAGQIAQAYGRPVILLSTPALEEAAPAAGLLARGSARSVHSIDLYQLVQNQDHLLHHFGGHPFAAGLSLPVDNIPLFTEAINQELRRELVGPSLAPMVRADLEVTVSELGQALFQELKLLEPCGMGNPPPQLLIQNCWFENVRNQNISDPKGGKLRYIKTQFELWDDTANRGFTGIWWEHYASDIPQGRCDAIVELDWNARSKTYTLRLVVIRPYTEPQAATTELGTDLASPGWKLEGRSLPLPDAALQPLPTHQIWEQFVGIATYLSRTGKAATRQQIFHQLGVLGEASLECGFQALAGLGFKIQVAAEQITVGWQPPSLMVEQDAQTRIQQFIAVLQEEQFHRQYLQQMSPGALPTTAKQL